MRLLILLLIPTALLGCDGAATSSTSAGLSGTVRTVPHDGHTFVTLSNGHGASIIHHPGCECVKR